MRIRFGYFSNIPSHPISINSYFWEDISTENTSGLAVIACFSGGNDLFCLNLKSPNALVRLRHPSTLPPQTFDPELIILPYSSGTSGEWSLVIYVNSLEFLFANKHLASPAFATYSICSLWSINDTLAVHPPCLKSICPEASKSTNSLSRSRNLRLSHSLIMIDLVFFV